MQIVQDLFFPAIFSKLQAKVSLQYHVFHAGMGWQELSRPGIASGSIAGFDLVSSAGAPF